MAEAFRRHNPETPDIKSMIEKATESIRSHTPQPPVPSANARVRRILDPTVYGGEGASDKQPAHVPREKRTPDRAPKPLLTDEALQALDKIFRPSTPEAAPVVTPRETPVVREAQPVAVEAPAVIPHSQVEFLGTEEDQPPIPAPGTREGVVFEYQLRKAEAIIDRALADGYKPQLLVSEFSPNVVAFLRACGRDIYLVDELRAPVVTIEHRVAQATEALTAVPEKAQSKYPTRTPRANRRDAYSAHPIRRKLIMGAVAWVATPLALVTGGYVTSREVVCKPEGAIAALGCAAVAAPSGIINNIPVLNTVVDVLKFPVDATYSMFDKLHAASQPSPAPEAKR